MQNHIEKIVEKPPSQTSHHQPLSRRQSHNVNVEDIIAQQVTEATTTDKKKFNGILVRFFHYLKLISIQIFFIDAIETTRIARHHESHFTLCFFRSFVLVFLSSVLPQNSRARFTMTFELGQEGQIANITRPTINDLNTSSLAQIAQLVASTGQLFNIVDLNQWSSEHPEINVDDELKQTQAVLCMPIFNGQKNVIGVVQLINKVRKLLSLCLCSKTKKKKNVDPADYVEFLVW